MLKNNKKIIIDKIIISWLKKNNINIQETNKETLENINKVEDVMKNINDFNL